MPVKIGINECAADLLRSQSMSLSLKYLEEQLEGVRERYSTTTPPRPRLCDWIQSSSVDL